MAIWGYKSRCIPLGHASTCNHLVSCDKHNKSTVGSSLQVWFLSVAVSHILQTQITFDKHHHSGSSETPACELSVFWENNMSANESQWHGRGHI